MATIPAGAIEQYPNSRYLNVPTKYGYTQIANPNYKEPALQPGFNPLIYLAQHTNQVSDNGVPDYLSYVQNGAVNAKDYQKLLQENHIIVPEPLANLANTNPIDTTDTTINQGVKNNGKLLLYGGILIVGAILLFK